MSFVVDEFHKVTVSLGGRCPVGCRHCYTMTPQFIPEPSRRPTDVVNELLTLPEPFSIVCVSGDTDCFLDPEAGLQLIQLIAETFRESDVMFTTRLVPPAAITRDLIELGTVMGANQRLLVPGISLVSTQVPNAAETTRVSSTPARLRLLAKFADGGLPCLLALRPTFPFSIVNRATVKELIQSAAPSVVAILGETFILDVGGRLAARFAIAPSMEGDRESRMSFLPQATLWRKRSFPEEVAFAREVSRSSGVPYFMRSGSAIEYLRMSWDFDAQSISQDAALDFVAKMDDLDP
jgi:DNA repair photolyase